MQHPFQSVCAAQGGSFESSAILLVACGSKIFSIGYPNGSTLSQWPEQSLEPTVSCLPEVSDSAIRLTGAPPAGSELSTWARPLNSCLQTGGRTTDDSGPPGKKRKIKDESHKSPDIIKLVLSPDHKYAIAVTGDDKCIRVFSITESGKLLQLSQRCMPKRPCAILVTSDNQTILCGDKFGDVYSLPLLPRDELDIKELSPQLDPTKKLYNPTATNLTVHTARNRRALEEQLKRKAFESEKKKPFTTGLTKDPLNFDHRLLLGHVSMLTDMVFVTQTVDGKSRHHIITADRDEHIRVSRGPPQAHVIERYCLGHIEFISKICLVPRTNVLLSAGGDDWMGVWDWTSGKLIAKRDLKTLVSQHAGGQPSNKSGRVAPKIAVSGLWVMPAQRDDGNGQSQVAVVAIEDYSTTLLFAIDTSGIETPPHYDTYARALDVTSMGGNVIISYDISENGNRLKEYSLTVDESFHINMVDCNPGTAIEQANTIAAPVADRKSLDNLLSGVENLRKRDVDVDLDVDVDAEDVEEVA